VISSGFGQVVDLDRESRRIKAVKILSVLRDVWSGQLAGSRCLDLGCGIGVIADRLRPSVGLAVAMDLDWMLISRSPTELARLQGDGLKLPFCSAAFDLVICAQVYEHVSDPVQLAAEIERVLRPGGICYFSGPNRLWPYEYHYQAWLLHWLPDSWLTRARVLLKRDHLSKVTLYTYWQLRRLWRRFAVRDYTAHLIRHPDRFPGGDTPAWMRYIPSFVLSLLAFAVPNVNWVLWRPASGE
jgi:SAM-dependent methyltransferase